MEVAVRIPSNVPSALSRSWLLVWVARYLESVDGGVARAKKNISVFGVAFARLPKQQLGYSVAIIIAGIN
jgi:hypothetical protein